MNWDAIGAIAELLGAVAVLATLVYLARQIRQNRASVESASAETVLSNITAAFQNAATSSELARIIFTGQENIKTLTDEERGQFVFWFYGYFRILEQAYHHYLAGNFSESIWAGHTRHTQSLVNSSGVKQYWEMRREVFSPEFRTYIDELANEETSVIPSYLTVKEFDKHE
jgi:hypothetical protein